MRPIQRTFGVAVLAAMAPVVLALPARAAITNGSFESGLADWAVLGDRSVQDATFGLTPPEGSNQAVITTINDQINSFLEPDSLSGNSAVPTSDLEDALNLPRGTFDALSPSGGRATETSSVRQGFTAQAGSRLRFEWNFLTDETLINPSFDDFAAVYVVERDTNTQVSLSVLVNVAAASFQPSATPFASETGYQTAEIELPSTGVPMTGTYLLAVAVFDARDRLGGSALAVDNVRLLPPVPETPTVLMVGVGLLGLAWLSRPRRPGPPRGPGPPTTD